MWFGATYGSSCPIRLDDVVVNTDDSLVHGDIAVPGSPTSCTADARPHSFVVTLQRTSLPPGPFAVQLDPQDPLPGAPGERTEVHADLSEPGAVAADHQITPSADDAAGLGPPGPPP